jgi:hypothetical protein
MWHSPIKINLNKWGLSNTWRIAATQKNSGIHTKDQGTLWPAPLADHKNIFI